MPADGPIGSIPFTDGATRPVFLDADGRQYILGDDQNRVYGVWIYIDEGPHRQRYATILSRLRR